MTEPLPHAPRAGAFDRRARRAHRRCARHPRRLCGFDPEWSFASPRLARHCRRPARTEGRSGRRARSRPRSGTALPDRDRRRYSLFPRQPAATGSSAHGRCHAGLAFGPMAWAFMYNVVLPITFGLPNTIPARLQLINQLGIHALGVGLPIAWFASRSARRG
jgi:hypothetical protein